MIPSTLSGPPVSRIFRTLAAPLLIGVAALVLLAAAPAHAAPSETMAERNLRRIVERQKQLFADAEKQGDKLDMDAFQTQAQSIAHDYDRLLADNQNFAAAYAAYGYFLGKVGMKKESLAILLKANQLDPDIPLVKNQIGNALAESGHPIEAAEYFLAAIKLDPNEPLYHYQFGTVLSEARDTFLKSGEWTRPALDKAMHDAFKRASELAPDRFEYAYRYAMSFYELETPDWDGALKAWSALEEKAQSPLERQTMRLQAANVFIKMGKLDHARTLLASVDDPKLDGQKQRLLVQLDPAKK
ncbi:MAG TPA: tetratricopeptide repeat protein [Opitutaceae bacterium]|nr:tetratricopeptide repeat protein [Opitutaceae bacterium]